MILTPNAMRSMIATKKGIIDQMAVKMPRFSPDYLEAVAVSTTE